MLVISLEGTEIYTGVISVSFHGYSKPVYSGDNARLPDVDEYGKETVSLDIAVT